MRPLIVTAFVSADGVMEDPQWTFEAVEFDEAAYEIKGREQTEASALLLGRRTYEEFAPVWPMMEEFAEYNAMPRYVVSTTLQQDDSRWPATILPGLDEVAALRETEGGPILVPPGELHVTRATGTEPLKLLCFFPTAAVAPGTAGIGRDRGAGQRLRR